MDILKMMPVSFIDNANPFIKSLVVFCATTLGTITIVLAIIFVFLRPLPKKDVLSFFENWSRRFLDFFVLAVSGGGIYILTVFLKNIFNESRPYILNPQIHSFFTENDLSFPSGHASTFMAIAVSIYIMNKKAGLLFIAIALVVGIARILSGVHTPLDILGGYVFGAIFAVFSSWFLRKVID